MKEQNKGQKDKGQKGAAPQKASQPGLGQGDRPEQARQAGEMGNARAPSEQSRAGQRSDNLQTNRSGQAQSAGLSGGMGGPSGSGVGGQPSGESNLSGGGQQPPGYEHQRAAQGQGQKAGQPPSKPSKS